MKKKTVVKPSAIFCAAIFLLTSLFLTTSCACNDDIGGDWNPDSPEPAEPIRITAGIASMDSTATLNPFWASAYRSQTYLALIYEPLVYSSEDGAIQPLLASDWEQSEDGFEWTISIDPRAKWSDGEPVTADDVIFTYQLHWENSEWTQARSNMALLKGDGYDPATDALTKIDTNTIKFKLRDTFAPRVFLTSLTSVFICPKHIWEPVIADLEADGDGIENYQLEEEPKDVIQALLVGSGPFMFGELTTISMLFEDNPDYWMETPANVDEVLFKIYGTDEDAWSALVAGDVDMIESMPVILTPQLLGTGPGPDIETDVTTKYNSTVMFYLNLRYPPLNILEVRQAIDMVIDRQGVIDFAANGFGTLPQMVPFAPGLVESNPDVAWADQYVDIGGDPLSHEERIEIANALLDAVPGMSTIAAGIGGIRTYDGQKVSFEGLYLSSHSFQQTDDTYRSATEIVAADLAEIGIEIVPTEETGAFGPKVFSGNQVWDYETIVFGYPFGTSFSSRGSLSPVTQWASETWGTSYDGSVVGWNNDPSEAPPGTVDGRPQTYDTPYDDPTQEQLDKWLVIYNQLVADSAPLTEALRETRLIADPDIHRQAVLDVQEDFMDALPIICLYHPHYISAFRTDRFEGWGDPEGIYFGRRFIPPTVSVKTLLSIQPVDS